MILCLTTLGCNARGPGCGRGWIYRSNKKTIKLARLYPPLSPFIGFPYIVSLFALCTAAKLFPHSPLDSSAPSGRRRQMITSPSLTLFLVLSFLILLLWFHLRMELSISELCSMVAACTASSINSAVSVSVLIFLSL